MPLYFADGCFVSLSKSHVLAHRGGAVSRIILVISKYIDTSSNYTQCTQEMACFATHHETLALDCLQGVILQKKKLHIPGAHSLSHSLSLLHWKREQEERSGGVGPWSGPTTQFPFLVNMSPIQRQLTSSLIAVHLSLPTHSLNEPLRLASCMCMHHRWLSLLCHEPLLLLRSPTNPILHNHITRGNSFVSVPRAVHAIEQILLRRWLDIEFFK